MRKLLGTVMILALVVNTVYWWAGRNLSDGDIEKSSVSSGDDQSESKEARRHAPKGDRRVLVIGAIEEGRRPESSKGVPLKFTTEILVVDEEQEAVAGAEIRLCDWRHDGWAFGIRRGEDRRRFLTNGDGIARLEGLEPGSHKISASFEGRLGFAWAGVPGPDDDLAPLLEAQAKGQRSKIVLASFKPLTIEVMGVDGKPVADAIVIVVDPESTELPDTYRHEFNGGALSHFMTGSDGRVELHMKKTRLYPLFDAKKLRIMVLRYGEDAPEKTFDLATSGSTLRINVPAMTAIDFQPRKPSGEPVEGWADLFWATGERSPLGREAHVSWGIGALKSKMVDGYVWNWMLRLPPEGTRVCAFVPGAQITTLLRGRDFVGRQVTHRLSDEPEQTLVLQTGDQMARLRLKCVDTTGAPYDFDRLTFELTNSEQRVRYLHFGRPDESGAAQVSVAPDFVGRLHLIPRSVPTWRGRDRSASAVASFEVSGLVPGEVKDLGTATLGRPPLLVSGTAQDGKGDALAGVMISVKLRDARGRPVIRHMRSLSTTTDESGRFEILAKARDGHSYSLNASGEWSTEPKEFQPGASDLSLTLTKQGSIKGRVRARSREMEPELTVSYLKAGSEGYARRIYRRESGHFEQRQVLPGTYEIIMAVAGIEVRRIAGVEVGPSMTVTPPELEDLVVGDDIIAGKLTVLGPDGKAIRGLRPRFEGNAERSMSAILGTRTDSSGVATIFVKRGETFSLTVDDYRKHGPEARRLMPRSFESPTFPLKVTLRYRPVVRLELSRPLPGAASWKIVLSRQRTQEEIDRRQAKRERIRARLKNRELPHREISPRALLDSVTLNTGEQSAEIRARNTGSWEVFVQPSEPKDVRNPPSVLIERIDIGEIESQSFKIEISEAELAAISAMIQ